MTDAYKLYIIIHMRTTINLNKEIVENAMQATGVKQKTLLIHMGLKALIKDSARQRLAALHGAVKKAKSAQRRKM